MPHRRVLPYSALPETPAPELPELLLLPLQPAAKVKVAAMSMATTSLRTLPVIALTSPKISAPRPELFRAQGTPPVLLVSLSAGGGEGFSSGGGRGSNDEDYCND
jgi:hypothetical protein